jgi:hypothetical protein
VTRASGQFELKEIRTQTDEQRRSKADFYKKLSLEGGHLCLANPDLSS